MNKQTEAAAQITDATAYTKGWESTAKQFAGAKNNFAAKYGTESAEFFAAGWDDKAQGAAKWETFIDVNAPEDYTVATTDAEDNVVVLAQVEHRRIDEPKPVEDLTDEELATELDEARRNDPEAVADAEESVNWISIAEQRDAITKDLDAKEIATRRAAIVARKNHHRAGFRAAAAGKMLSDSRAKFSERHGAIAGQDFRNGFIEYDDGVKLGTAWAK